MARTGTKPTSDKLNFTSQPSVPANQKLSAAEYNYMASKANAPGLNDAWSAVVKFDDNYLPPDYTMIGNIEYTIDATNAGTGNVRKDTIIGNGGTITFTGFTIKDSSLTPTSNVVTTVNGTEYTILFLRVGSVSEVYLKANSLTGGGDTTPPTVTSATVENADPDALVVVFDEVVTITDTTGLSLDGSWAGTTITGVTGSGTNTLTFALDTPVANGEAGNFVYGGTNNIVDSSTNGLVAGSTAVTNNVSAIDNPTITSMSVEDGAATSVIVNFNQNVNITNQTGWTFRINATGDTLTGVSGSGTSQLTFTCTTSIVNGDTLDMSYDSGTGNCVATDDSAPLQSFTQTSVTNNIAVSSIYAQLTSVKNIYDDEGLATSTDNEYGTVDGSNIISVWKGLTPGQTGATHNLTITTGGDPLPTLNNGVNFLSTQILRNATSQSFNYLNVAPTANDYKFSIYLVINVDAFTGSFGMIFGNTLSSAAYRFSLWVDDRTPTNAIILTTSNAANEYMILNATVDNVMTPGTLQVVTVTYDHSLGTDNMKAYNGTTLIGTDNKSTGVPDVTIPDRERYVNHLSYPISGVIRTMVFQNIVESDTTRNNFINALKTKYSIA